MSKSHVGLGYTVCPVCLEKSADSILMDKKGREQFDDNKKYFTGLELCNKHQEAKDNDMVAIIVVRKEPTEENTFLNLDRTGEVFHVDKKSFAKLFKAMPPAGGIAIVPEHVGKELSDLEARVNSDSDKTVH